MRVGYVSWLLDWHWRAAETAFGLAIRLDPSNATAHRTLGHALSQTGRHAEAESAMRRTRELEPLEPITYALSAQVAFQARQYPAAVEHARRAILIDSEFWIGYMQLGQAYQRNGSGRSCAGSAHGRGAVLGQQQQGDLAQGLRSCEDGGLNEAREVLRQLESDSGERYVPPYAIALVHAGLGEREAVMEWLAKAYARATFSSSICRGPKWDLYRADPRFRPSSHGAASRRILRR